MHISSESLPLIHSEGIVQKVNRDFRQGCPDFYCREIEDLDLLEDLEDLDYLEVLELLDFLEFLEFLDLLELSSSIRVSSS